MLSDSVQFMINDDDVTGVKLITHTVRSEHDNGDYTSVSCFPHS